MMAIKPFPEFAPITVAGRCEKTILALFAVATIVMVYLTVVNYLDSATYHEEFRILYYLDPGNTNEKDYVGQFLEELPKPHLYWMLSNVAVASGVDLVILHKGFGLLSTFLFVIATGFVGWRVGGLPSVVLMVSLIAAIPIYFYQNSSAIPHAFAFPLLMWGLVCLLYDRLISLAVITVLSGLIYVPVSPVLGGALAWYFIIERKGLSSNNPLRWKQLRFVVGAGALTALLLLQQLVPVEGYGLPVVPGADSQRFPESGPDGRYQFSVFDPLRFVVFEFLIQFHESIPPEIVALVSCAVMALAGLGLYYLRHVPHLFGAFLSFIIPSAVFLAIVIAWKPFVAYRFILYPIFTMLPVLFSCGAAALFYKRGVVKWYSGPGVLVVVGGFVVSVGPLIGYSGKPFLRLDSSGVELMEFLQRQPKGSLVAAWPGQKETSLIPYVAGLPVLVNHKAHYPTYQGYVEQMRLRMFDLIDAYVARDAKALIKLRCRWQVDYLVVDQRLVQYREELLVYFAPFRERIKRSLEGVTDADLYFNRLPLSSVVFKSGNYVVVDLSMLTEEPVCDGRSGRLISSFPAEGSVRN